MSSPHSRRDELIAAILRATADVAARRTAHGQAVAERLGLASADVEVLTAISVEGAMTVGRIGELTGLTTGATTRMSRSSCCRRRVVGGRQACARRHPADHGKHGYRIRRRPTQPLR